MKFHNGPVISIADISSHQGYPPGFPVVDFQKMALWGMSGCVHRASIGQNSDKAFPYNWKACRYYLPVASYHYYENHIPPIKQAETYWTALEKNGYAGMMFLDLEDRDIVPVSYRHWDNWYQYLERLKILSGASADEIGIYIGYYYAKESFRYASYAERHYFKQYKLWYPWYFNNIFNPPYAILPYNLPWDDNDLLAVQTGTPVIGHAAGVYSQELDYNQVNGWDMFRLIFCNQSINIVKQLEINTKIGVRYG